jgi:hypothetical protein
VVVELNDTVGERERIFFSATGWEQVPGGIGTGPQSVIDEQIGDYDLLVGLMWKRFGTPIPGGVGSGTVHEVQQAIARWKQIGEPRVMFYFKRVSPADSATLDPAELAKIREFQCQLQKIGLTHAFDETDDFASLLRVHLQKVSDRLKRTAANAAGGGNPTTDALSGADQLAPSDAAKGSPAARRRFRDLPSPRRRRTYYAIAAGIAAVTAIFWPLGLSQLARHYVLREGFNAHFDVILNREPVSALTLIVPVGTTSSSHFPKPHCFKSGILPENEILFSLEGPYHFFILAEDIMSKASSNKPESPPKVAPTKDYHKIVEVKYTPKHIPVVVTEDDASH